MATNEATVCRNAALDGRTALLASGYLRFYTGAQPVNGDAALTGGNTLIGECRFSATAFAPASGGMATANAITSGTPSATGLVGFARAFKSDGTTPVLDESAGVSGSGANIILNDNNFVSGTGSISVSAYTLTQPGAGS